MSVNTEHHQYAEKKEEWKRNNDCDAGDIAIKKGGVKYLPMPDRDDPERYEDFLVSALFTNYTGTKRRELTGKVFRKPPVVELPPQIDYIQKKADNGNMTLDSMAQRVVGNVWLNGRYALVATFPDVPRKIDSDGVEIAPTAEETAGLQAYIATYPALSVINWNETDGQLDMVVLHEKDYVLTEFTRSEIDVYRVYRLENIGGKRVATFQVYKNNEPQDEARVISFNGTTAEEIPVVLVGSEDNNPDCDFAPASDICANNISDYQMFAISAENGFMVGQGMFHVDTGQTDAKTFTEANPIIKVGSRKALVTQGGKGEIFTQSENTIARALTQDIKNTLYDLGVNSGGAQRGVETAEAAMIRAGTDTAVMNIIAQNVSDGFEQALRWCAMYMGGNPDDVKYDLNRQFFPVRLDPQLLAQISSLTAIGNLPNEIVYNYLRQSSDILKGFSDEDIALMIEQQSPIV